MSWTLSEVHDLDLRAAEWYAERLREERKREAEELKKKARKARKG